MKVTLIHSFQSELLKIKKSSVYLFCFFGAIFLPLSIFIVSLYRQVHINKIKSDIWQTQYQRFWGNDLFFVTMGIILIIGLLLQIEYKNNTWKQLNTTPQSLYSIFFAKNGIIFFCVLLCLSIFDFGLLLFDTILCLLFDHQFPKEMVPFGYIFIENLKNFVLFLPIIGFQYLLSLHFKNLMIPMAVGLFLFITTIITQSHEYNFLSPFAALVKYIILEEDKILGMSAYLYAGLYFVILTSLNLTLFILKKDKS